MMAYFTVKEFAAKNRANDAWPSSESAIWGLRAFEKENGFSGVFLKVGRRVLIDGDKFWEAVRKLQGGE